MIHRLVQDGLASYSSIRLEEFQFVENVHRGKKQ